MNDKPKHTEGDWQVSKESSTIITNEHGLIIGSASGCPDSGYFPSNETAVANAVLMAAAPRLLEALEALVEYADDPALCDDPMDLVNAARDAIAKAKPQPPTITP
jgi:hypothetical protein